ncbi:MAG: RNA polymerase sigma factor [Phycisphaerales bacterium]
MPDTPLQDDLALLRAFSKGDIKSLSTLADRYEAPLYGLALAILNHREPLARDAVQETWLRVIRHAGTFAGKSSVKTWLYRITINRCNDLRKRESREGELTKDAQDNSISASQPHASDITNDLQHAIRIATDKLPDDARLLLLLCYHRGLTHEEAAKVLDIPLGTLKSRLNASLTKLREALASHAEAPTKVPTAQRKEPRSDTL